MKPLPVRCLQCHSHTLVAYICTYYYVFSIYLDSDRYRDDSKTSRNEGKENVRATAVVCVVNAWKHGSLYNDIHKLVPYPGTCAASRKSSLWPSGTMQRKRRYACYILCMSVTVCTCLVVCMYMFALTYISTSHQCVLLHTL